MAIYAPHPIYGTVYDLDGSTALSSTVVSAINTSTNETLSSAAQYTTSSNGHYVIDPANFESGYTTGDVLRLIFSKTITRVNTNAKSTVRKYIEVLYTISGGSYELNQTMTYLDILDDAIDLVESNWNPNYTENETPIIDKVFDWKRADLGNTSMILVYALPEIHKANGFGSSSKYVYKKVVFDVRTVVSRFRAIKLLNEVKRILDSKIVNPDHSNDILDPDGEVRDLSDKSTGLWRFVTDAEFQDLNKAR